MRSGGFNEKIGQASQGAVGLINERPGTRKLCLKIFEDALKNMKRT